MLVLPWEVVLLGQRKGVPRSSLRPLRLDGVQVRLS